MFKKIIMLALMCAFLATNAVAGMPGQQFKSKGIMTDADLITAYASYLSWTAQTIALATTPNVVSENLVAHINSAEFCEARIQPGGVVVINSFDSMGASVRPPIYVGSLASPTFVIDTLAAVGALCGLPNELHNSPGVIFRQSGTMSITWVARRNGKFARDNQTYTAIGTDHRGGGKLPGHLQSIIDTARREAGVPMAPDAANNTKQGVLRALDPHLTAAFGMAIDDLYRTYSESAFMPPMTDPAGGMPPGHAHQPQQQDNFMPIPGGVQWEDPGQIEFR